MLVTGGAGFIGANFVRYIEKPRSLMAFVADRPGHDPRYAIDATKIRNELGWEPSVSFEAGCAETIAWYQANAPFWKPWKARPLLPEWGDR